MYYLKLMKAIILFFILLLGISATCQELSIYRDSSNQFEVGLPVGWRYEKPKNHPGILLICIRNPVDTIEKYVENFNLNVVDDANSSLDSAFAHMLYFNKMTKDFQIIKQGAKMISGRPYKWVISTHTNQYSSQVMNNYVLLTYKDDKAYILTFLSTPKNFDMYLPFFERIAETFKLNFR